MSHPTEPEGDRPADDPDLATSSSERQPEVRPAEATGAPSAPPEPDARRPWSGALALLLTAALGPLAVLWLRPPAPAGADRSASAFAAERAAVHLEWLAAEPRPWRSAANERVRARLVQELEALGLEVEVQAGELDGGGPSGESLALHNVLARLPGENPEPARGDALLLVAHHDSVAAGPGAADDAAGVAAVLETLRALAGDTRRWNDLFVLLTDGEEAGLLGAYLFVEERHPWLARVGAVANFEARGAGGPSILFQTGPRSGGLVEHFAAEAPFPFGTSLAPAVYEELPNDTDFTVLAGAGLPGLNFAFVGGGRAYHTGGDTPAALDRGSLQHHGEAMLSLARAFAFRSPAEIADAEPREFLLLPGLRLRWPLFLTAPLCIGAALAGLVLLVARGGRATARVGLVGAVLGLLGAAVVAVASASAAYYGAVLVHALTGAIARAVGVAPEPAPGSNLAAGEWLAAGVWLAALGSALLLVALLGRGRDRVRAARRVDALGAGALLAWVPLAAALALRVPGAGHVGLFALAGCALTAALFAPRGLRPEGSRPVPDPTAGGLRALGALVAWLPAAVALLPLLVLLVQVGSVEPVQERVLGAGVAALAATTALPVLAVAGARRERLALGLLLAALVALGLYAWRDLHVA